MGDAELVRLLRLHRDGLPPAFTQRRFVLRARKAGSTVRHSG